MLESLHTRSYCRQARMGRLGVSSTVRRLSLAAVLVASLLAVAGCGGGDGGGGGTGDAASASGGSAGAIKVAANVEMTGPGAELGLSRLYGYQAAANAINDAGGIKVDGDTYQIEVVPCDNETEPTQGVQCARKAAEEEGVLLALAPDPGFESAYTLLKQKNVPLVFGSGGPVTALLAEDAEGNPSLFNEGYGFDLILEAYFNQIESLRPDVKTFAALLPQDDNGVVFDELFKEAAKTSSIEYLGTVFHPPAASGDFSSFLTSLKGKNPDMLYLGFYNDVVVPAAEQASNLDVAPVLGAHSIKPSVLAGADFRGTTMLDAQIGGDNAAADALPAEDKAAFEQIEAASKGKEFVAAVASNGYIALKVVEQAIQQAGSVDSEAVRQELLNIQYDGPLGPAAVDAALHAIKVPLSTIVFEPNGDVVQTNWDAIDADEPAQTFPIPELG